MTRHSVRLRGPGRAPLWTGARAHEGEILAPCPGESGHRAVLDCRTKIWKVPDAFRLPPPLRVQWHVELLLRRPADENQGYNATQEGFQDEDIRKVT